MKESDLLHPLSSAGYWKKRQLGFDRISQKLRLFIGIFALIPLYWWINTGCPYIIEEISRSLGKFLRFGLGIIYIMVLVPGTVVLAGTLTNRGSDKVTRETGAALRLPGRIDIVIYE